MTLRTLAGAAIVAVLMTTHAHAKPIITCNDRGCYAKETAYMVGATPRKAQTWSAPASVASTDTVILPHPAGCPRVAFCGCGAAVKVFGRAIRDLWLVDNWVRKFPRAALAAGMAAIRPDRGHVLIVEQVLGGGKVLAFDANSGGHQTRRHVRDVSGWIIVNPHGAV